MPRMIVSLALFSMVTAGSSTKVLNREQVTIPFDGMPSGKVKEGLAGSAKSPLTVIFVSLSGFAIWHR